MNYSDSDSKIWLQLLGKCFLWCKHNDCVCPAPTLSFQSDLLVGFRVVHMDLSIFVVRMRSCLYLTSSAQRRENQIFIAYCGLDPTWKDSSLGLCDPHAISIGKKNTILNARELLKNLLVLLFISWSVCSVILCSIGDVLFCFELFFYCCCLYCSQNPWLENPRDKGTWRAAVPGVTQSGTRLKQLSTHAHILFFRALL